MKIVFSIFFIDFLIQKAESGVVFLLVLNPKRVSTKMQCFVLLTKKNQP